MSTIPDNKTLTGTWKDGQIILDDPADWPEGCRVVVTLGKSQEVDGMTEEEQSNDPRRSQGGRPSSTRSRPGK